MASVSRDRTALSSIRDLQIARVRDWSTSYNMFILHCVWWPKCESRWEKRFFVCLGVPC